MARSCSNTISAAPTGSRRWRPASLPPIRIMEKPLVATSASRVTTTAHFHFATFASGCFHERTHTSLRDDVPPVLHLGGLVRDHGHLPRSNAPLHGPADRSGLRRDCHRRAGVTLLHGRRRRSLFLE